MPLSPQPLLFNVNNIERGMHSLLPVATSASEWSNPIRKRPQTLTTDREKGISARCPLAREITFRRRP